MAVFAVNDNQDALDVVQDAMLTLAQKYASRPAVEWRPLFYRILRNRINDTHRSRQRWRRIFDGFGRSDESQDDPVAAVPGPVQQEPERRSELDTVTQALAEQVAGLPARQREAFLLRAWEGLDVAETALAMGCSSGSVKTHYSRAVHSLRAALQDDRP